MWLQQPLRIPFLPDPQLFSQIHLSLLMHVTLPLSETHLFLHKAASLPVLRRADPYIPLLISDNLMALVAPVRQILLED